MRILLRILGMMLLIYVVWSTLRRLVANVFPQAKFKQPGSQPHWKNRIVKQGKMEKDPVCGTYVDVATAPHAIFSGETKYFCSSSCLNKFRQVR